TNILKTMPDDVPLRRELYQVKPSGNKDRFTILVMGGSQGARIINDTVLEIVEKGLLDGIKIIHITGPKEFERLRDRIEKVNYPHYKVYGFVKDIWNLYREADLVVSRAGAGSVIEFATVSIPAILIPYKGAEGHQYLNARWLADSGGAIIIEQDQLSALSLVEAILNIVKSDKINEMRESISRLNLPSGSYILTEELIKIITGGSHDKNK
ncbi:MAG TPA: glycosyltransferase, partial [bacterium]|nr:glycosyltransferase [bacterium]